MCFLKYLVLWWLYFLNNYYLSQLIIKDIDLPDFQGEPDEVYKKKGQAAFDLIKGPCIVEYTSLGFNATNGMSGNKQSTCYL